MTGLGIYQKITRARGGLGAILQRKLDRQPKVYILVYHRVLPDVGFNPYHTKISVETFRDQLVYLKSRYPIVSLTDVEVQHREGIYRAPVQVVITFDDGYRDNYDFAFPILKDMGISATFFLVTDYIDTNEVLWDLELAHLSLRRQLPSKIAISETVTLLRLSGESDYVWLSRLNEAFKACCREARGDLLASIRSQAKSFGRIDPEDGCLSWKNAKEMQNAGMEIGAHSCSHPSLARISPEEARLEIRGSKKMIEKHLGISCEMFAFPFGSRYDYNDDLIKAVEEEGFRSSVLNIRGYNTCKDSPFCLRRIPATEDLSLRFEIG